MLTFQATWRVWSVGMRWNLVYKEGGGLVHLAVPEETSTIMKVHILLVCWIFEKLKTFSFFKFTVLLLAALAHARKKPKREAGGVKESFLPGGAKPKEPFQPGGVGTVHDVAKRDTGGVKKPHIFGSTNEYYEYYADEYYWILKNDRSYNNRNRTFY